ncbi:SH3 domain-containing protein [uncultured Rhodoblastus sp.]|uniref:SH3 domain-containing protein n=1 Tax=uncultured Rhodoblastus sp. TaxID=543037 RepID=UPI0025E5E474|nr:SH3 domain-containing protein [uncultured Rhodoblastus sp.]
MFRFRRAFFVAFVFALLPAFALAGSDIRTQRVDFKDGRATIRGGVTGYASIDHVFPAGAGESIEVTIKSSKASYFNMNPPGSDVAIFIGSSEGSTFSGVAPTSGDYTARVYLMRNEARRGTTARYTLTIAVGQKSAAKEKGPDFADGLSGGPDYWEVTGIGPGDSLSLRQTPSPKGQLIASFANGTALKNLGCKISRGQRWCQVEQAEKSARRGWVNGRYLREGNATGAAAPGR